MTRRSIFLIISTLFSAASLLAASNTTNVQALDRFFDAFEQRQGPVRILSFGDSMADSWRSITRQLVTRLLDKRPFAGTSLNNSFNRSVRILSNGGTMEPPSSLWFSFHYRLPGGAGVRWYNAQNTNGILANRLGLYWIATPAGGQFELLASEKSGAPTRFAILDGFSKAPEGRFFSNSVPLSEYHLEVRSLTGTNYVLDPELVNTQTNGLHVAWLDYGGISLQQVSAIPRAIRAPILRAYSPDLLIWHFKEHSATGLEAPLEEQEQWFRQTVPDMDVLYIGTPHTEFGTGGLDEAENQVIRSFAISQARAFVDCMTPGISYQWLLDHGYMDDPVHPNFQGGVFLGDIAWNDLGFFALGTDRRLALRRRASAWTLEANLSSGLIYDFEVSNDFALWSQFASRTNASNAFQHEMDFNAPARFFRMRVRPVSE